MKNLFVFVAIATFSVTSACTQQVDLEAEKTKVKTVVDQFAQVWETEDVELFSRILAHDADMVNFGTDTTENYVGWEAVIDSSKKYFASFENTKVTVKDQVIKVHRSGHVAWFSEIMDWDLVSLGQPVRIKGCRFTGVLEKRNGNWVFVQFHASIPVSGQLAQYF